MTTHVPDKLTYVVVNENTLGYLWFWDSFTWVGILATSVIRGAVKHDGSSPVSILDVVRIATKEDFDTFRLSSEGRDL